MIDSLFALGVSRSSPHVLGMAAMGGRALQKFARLGSQLPIGEECHAGGDDLLGDEADAVVAVVAEGLVGGGSTAAEGFVGALTDGFALTI